MIRIQTKGNTYLLTWNGKNWRDKAGHIWIEGKTLLFSSKHGAVGDSEWSIVDHRTNQVGGTK